MWIKNRVQPKKKVAPAPSSGSTSQPASTDTATSLSRRRTLPRFAPTATTATNKTVTNGTSKRLDNSHYYHDKGTNIQVVLRCRGRNEQELAEESPIILEPSGLKDVLLTTNNKRFSFDRVFDQHATQEHIYLEVVQPILDQVLEGFNCTIFAYGQTGSGKTYTMEGNLEQGRIDAGIIPRVISNLFEALDSKGREYSVKVSLLELYNEELRDLLNPTNHQQQIRIFEDKISSGVIVQGIEEKFVQNAEEGLDVLKSGIKYRSTGATKCNEKSSRSHSIFSLNIHIRESVPGKEDVFRIGKLNLVDLAGSENISRSGAELMRAREAGMINQSLLTLGRVINHLVEHSSHIPYRESKLTRLLKDSLGGKTRTCIIATVSIAKVNQEEIVSTLDYANRAKNIRNRPEANQPANRNVHIRDLELKIDQLKADLLASYEKNGVYMTYKSYEAMKEENQHLKDSVKDKQDRLDKAKHDLVVTESKMRDVTTKIDSIIRECDRKVEHIRTEEKRTRSEQAEALLDYFGKFELDLKSLNKEVKIAGKRCNHLYQQHLQDDQRHLDSWQTDLDKWKTVVTQSMELQIQRLKEQNQKQKDLFQKEKEQEKQSWAKLQQVIMELSESRQHSLDNTVTSLNHTMTDHLELLETSKVELETEKKKHAAHIKTKMEEVETTVTELHDDQDRYKKILSQITSLNAQTESQKQLIRSHSEMSGEIMRKRPLEEPEKEPIPSKRPNR